MKKKSERRKLTAGMQRPARPIVMGAVMSLAAHAAVAVVLYRLPSPARAMRAEAPSYQVEVAPIGAPTGGAGASTRGRLPTNAEPVEAGGMRSAQNLDARDRGQGGDATGPERAILMLDRAHDILLFDSPLNNLAAAQQQRIRTARSRATLENRRATPNPNDDAFLASGDGRHAERRPVSATDATLGARVAPVASVQGGLPSVDRPGDVASPSTGAARTGGAATRFGGAAGASDGERGTDAASPGRGILQGRGSRASEAARVARGRPRVDRGPAATPATAQDSRIRDDEDTENLASEMMQSWVQSTAHTGPRRGAGVGGLGGGGTPGVGGGRQEGGRAASYGPGDGRYAALDTSDARYRRWFLASSRRVQDALRFPRARALAMDQGTTVFRIVVRRDGTLRGAPRLVRSSGFEDLDRAALAAIRSATPFAPLPDDLAPQLAQLSLSLPVEFSNPMVR